MKGNKVEPTTLGEILGLLAFFVGTAAYAFAQAAITARRKTKGKGKMQEVWELFQIDQAQKRHPSYQHSRVYDSEFRKDYYGG